MTTRTLRNANGTLRGTITVESSRTVLRNAQGVLVGTYQNGATRDARGVLVGQGDLLTSLL